MNLDQLNEQDPQGNTYLMTVVANAWTGDALKAIEMGVVLDAQDNYMRNTALHLAVAKGWQHVDTERKDTTPLGVITQSLLGHGANPNIQDENGNTPLHIAVARRDVMAMNALLENGANLDIKNKKHEKPADMLNMTYAAMKEFIHHQCYVYTLPTQTEWEESKSKLEEIFKTAEHAATVSFVKYTRQHSPSDLKGKPGAAV